MTAKGGDVCSRCGGRAVAAKDAKTRQETDVLACWECGAIIARGQELSPERCRCKGNVKLQRFGIEVKEQPEDGTELAPGDSPRGNRSVDAELATQAPVRRTSPPHGRPDRRKLEKRMLETFG